MASPANFTQELNRLQRRIDDEFTDLSKATEIQGEIIRLGALRDRMDFGQKNRLTDIAALYNGIAVSLESQRQQPPKKIVAAPKDTIETIEREIGQFERAVDSSADYSTKTIAGWRLRITGFRGRLDKFSPVDVEKLIRRLNRFETNINSYAHAMEEPVAPQQLTEPRPAPRPAHPREDYKMEPQRLDPAVFPAPGGGVYMQQRPRPPAPNASQGPALYSPQAAPATQVRAPRVPPGFENYFPKQGGPVPLATVQALQGPATLPPRAASSAPPQALAREPQRPAIVPPRAAPTVVQGPSILLPRATPAPQGPAPKAAQGPAIPPQQLVRDPGPRFRDAPPVLVEKGFNHPIAMFKGEKNQYTKENTDKATCTFCAFALAIEGSSLNFSGQVDRIVDQSIVEGGRAKEVYKDTMKAAIAARKQARAKPEKAEDLHVTIPGAAKTFGRSITEYQERPLDPFYEQELSTHDKGRATYLRLIDHLATQARGRNNQIATAIVLKNPGTFMIGVDLRTNTYFMGDSHGISIPGSENQGYIAAFQSREHLADYLSTMIPSTIEADGQQLAVPGYASYEMYVLDPLQKGKDDKKAD